MRDVTTLPILADCNTGFADLHTISHVVLQLALLGIEGICLEDKAYPRRNSLVESPKTQKLEAPGRFAAKLRTAPKGSGPALLAIVAPLESLVVAEELARALEPADLHRRAGTDVLLVHSTGSDCLSDSRSALSFVSDIFSLEDINRYSRDAEMFRAREQLYSDEATRSLAVVEKGK